jgi:hypothetical protein
VVCPEFGQTTEIDTHKAIFIAEIDRNAAARSKKRSRRGQRPQEAD